MWLMFTILGCKTVVEAPEIWPNAGCVADEVAEDVTWNTEQWWQRSIIDDVETHVQAHVPASVNCTGAIVMAPGGFQAGTPDLNSDQSEALADMGFMVVAYDPRGRGESEGEEDANGALGQRDLAELLRWVAARPDVDPQRVVLFSRSFGASLASGALGRFSDLKVRAWVDYEGPGWMEEDLAHASDQNQETFAAIVDQQPDSDLWWDDREPAGWISNVNVDYYRVQGVPDHALGEWMGHAEAMVGGATSASSVWFNNHLITQPLTADQLRDLAISGGVEPGNNYITNTIISIMK